jgi:hypothetical protein
LGIGGQHDVGFGPMRSPHGGIGKLASLGILMMFMTLNFFIEMVAYCLGWERSLLQVLNIVGIVWIVWFVWML